ncbi:MAG: DUF2490 domain-containing protein [Puniceicoccaceae bacterium]|nr:MAG: DUF2490 domain-containing protein [Puniceicoccaceae bacterium]
MQGMLNKPLIRRLSLIILVLIPFCPATLLARDDLQAWQMLSLNFWQSGPHSASLYMDHRLVDDLSTTGVWVGGPRYKYAAHKNLQLGLGFVYLDVKNLETGSWTYQLRPELEINPRFKISENLSFHFRNRLEVRYIESQSGSNVRSRHRPQLTHSIQWKAMEKIYANTELFYSHETHQVNEFRTVPVGLGFKLTDSAKLDLFYLIQSRRQGGGSDWRHNHVMGTHLIYSF